MTARIPPLPPDERTPQQDELLGTARIAGQDANIFTTLVRHEGLFRKWMPFGGKLLAGKLPARERELLILRTGWNCRAEYEWGQHVRIGEAAGLTPAEIERIPGGPDAEGWAPSDRTLLQAADELHAGSTITEPTWSALAGRYDEKQLIEVCMVVGHYHLVAFTLNSLGVEREDGLPGFPHQPQG
jgi:alkylhydroperoxidase family enzyme